MIDKLKRIAALLLSLVLLLSVTACGKEEDEDDTGMTINPNQSTISMKAADDVFTLGYDADESLNPLRTKSQANYIVDCLVYEFAVELDQDFNAEGNIIKSWDTDNGFSWLLTVDTTVTFHDGSYVTAEDVVYSVDQAKKSDVYASRLNKIWGISALNDDTVMVTLSEVNYMFPRLLNVPVIKKGSSTEMPEGTGQYQFDLDMTKLLKYEDHRYAENTPIDVIYLHDNGTPDEKIEAYATSVVDLAVNDPTSLSRLGYGSNNEIRHFSTTNMQYIGFNCEQEFTCYPEYRRAMSYAVDRDYIANTVFNGSAKVAMFPVSPFNSLYNDSLAEQYAFNLETAQRIFQGQGVQDYDQDGMCEYQLPGGIAEIEIDFIVAADNTDKVKAAQRIVEDMKSIGINVKLRQLTWTDYQNAIVYGQYDMCYGEVKLTADFSMIDMLSTNGIKNFYKVKDPNVYEVVLAYQSAVGATERAQNCDIMCKYLADNAYIIPICFEEQQVLTHRDVVSGLEPTQYNVFYNFKNWEIDVDLDGINDDGDDDDIDFDAVDPITGETADGDNENDDTETDDTSSGTSTNLSGNVTITGGTAPEGVG